MDLVQGIYDEYTFFKNMLQWLEHIFPIYTLLNLFPTLLKFTKEWVLPK